jgi:hypothetical protein
MTAPWTKYRKSNTQELRPYIPGEDLTGVSIAQVDKEKGSPKPGDMIARNGNDHNDQWLVSKEYFATNYVPA